MATKENCEDINNHHAFMSKLNRGGLWFITDDMQSIMLIAEKYFRKGTVLLQKHLIEFKLICQDITKDATVQLKWENICRNYELRTDNHVKKRRSRKYNRFICTNTFIHLCLKILFRNLN